ncbi:UDP-2,3-diacylglucosamine diphosphatase LpxI [Candidatus Aerophobetes bacterium]|nr:UDP-2,3-diacylglucosamine diphosphatase LpxI [Candidatus Aerophobetes bacterium]
MNKIGLLAGSGKLPLLFATKCKEKIITVAIKRITSPKISRKTLFTYWLPLNQVDKCIDLFKKEGIKEVIALGKFDKRFSFDRSLKKFSLSSVLSELEDGMDLSFFNLFSNLLKREGIRLISPLKYLSSYLTKEGTLSLRYPSDKEWEDLRFGYKMAKKIADLDIGQTIVVKNLTILAMETIEGTDKTILRGGKYGKGGVTVVKVARTNQDMRFDIPLVGLQTLKTLIKAKGNVLGLEAGKVLLIEKEEMVKLANKKRISIIGFKDNTGGNYERN